MKKVAVLGAGMVGSAMAIDLVKDFEVTSIDISEQNLDLLKGRNKSISTVKHDLKAYEGYAELLKPYDFIITAVPGFMGYKTLEAVIKAKKSVVDISFFPEDALALDTFAKENNVTAIVDCGVAPGMSNFIIGYYNERMKIESFECLVGGLPKKRVKPFEYKAPFSPIDVIEEYTRPARYIAEGRMVTMPALSETELINFDRPGTLESFNTDGLRSLLFTMGHIPNMKEKTLRYPGHIDLIVSLQQAGFFNTTPIKINDTAISPLEFSSKILISDWKLQEGEEEFTVMRITVKSKEKTVVYELYDEYDKHTNISSMARTTGYTCTGALNLLAKEMFTDKGVFPPEYVGKHENCFTFIINYLKERNVIYTVKES